jgi:Copper type II ascorbate-dependent monooxygenase, C-terminal domain
MRHFVLACVLFAAISGCKKSDPTGDDDGMVFNDAPAITGDLYELKYPAISDPVGNEDTQCVWMRLSNTAPIKVHQMHNVLSTLSHHLIVYKDDQDTTEQLTPMPCQAFTGALNATGKIQPLAITQKHDDEITLPDGVAYTLDANQMVKLEMHYINTTDAVADASATVDLYAADPATIQNEAGLLFAGSLDIDIPANQQFTLHQFLTLPSTFDLSSSHVFAMTGHEHKLGTGVQVNVGMGSAGPLTSVYDPNPFLWSEPITQNFTPDFAVPKNGGFDFTCTYTNTTNAEVKFGENTTDEMCFFWVYYWPSQGSKVCAHTQQLGGAAGYNICCPGDSNCGLIDSKF